MPATATRPLRQWVDDILNAGDEWIDSRLEEWVDGHACRLDQGAVRHGPRAQPQGDRQEAPGASRPSAARSRRSAPRSPGSTPRARRPAGPTATMPTTLQSWSDAQLREEAREWQQGANGEWSFGAVNETLFRFMSEHCRAWADKEKAAGREPGAADIAAKRAAIVKKFNDDQGQVRRDPGRRRREEAEGDRRRRPLRAGHRAAREPAHRQPAARPLRPPGRSRPLQVLPVARRRPDAHLRLGPHGRRAAEARPAGRRGHHPPLDQQGAGEGAAEGRGAQLRLAQVRAQVRRRDERSAQGDLRAPHRHHGARRRRARPSPTCASRWCRSWSRSASRPTPTPSSGTRPS